MRLWVLPLGLSLALGGTAAWAQGADSGAFVTRLGSDTIAVERFVRTADSVWGEVVVREPEAARERYVARLDKKGNVTTYDITGSHGTIVATFHRDSVVLLSRVDGNIGQMTRSLANGWKADRYVVPLAEPTYGLHELLVTRAQAQAGKRVPFTWYYIGDFPDTGSVWARGDSAWIATPSDTIRMRVDGHGRIERSTDPGGTLQAEVTRLAAWPDLDAITTVRSLGTLSPRATVRGTVAGARIVIDYGRPSRRGRVIFGNVVPFNAVWRTGANAATTVSFDKDLVLGTVPVRAGTYTLFSSITATEWDLIVNKRAGEWGTDYDPGADLAKIPMALDRSASPPVEQFTISVEGDGIVMAWDTWKATLPVRASSVATTGQ
jgi:Protein of unknown function (DUF2911)